MAELKTKPTKASVKEFLRQVADEKRRRECQTIVKLMSDVTGARPEMWGNAIIGFGHYNYKYDRGAEADWMMLGFSPRKNNLTFYIMAGVANFSEILGRLGKHKSGGSCLYIKTLDDVDANVLRELLEKSFQVIASKKADSKRPSSTKARRAK